MDLSIFGSPGRTTEEDERDLSSPGRAEVRKVEPDIWQSRQRRSAEAQLHIFESSGRDEMRKWTYPYLEVLAEQVWKTNEIFRSHDRVEVRKAEL